MISIKKKLLKTLLLHPSVISDWLWRKQREQEGQRGRNSSSQPCRRAIKVVQIADDEEGLTQMKSFFCLGVNPIPQPCRCTVEASHLEMTVMQLSAWLFVF